VSRFLTDLWPDERRRPGVPRRDLDVRQQAVVDGLTAWRDAHAAELRRQPASVLTSATIRAIAERCPGTLEELGAVRGVGPMTLADIGEDVLAAVRATVRAPAR
jgi:DNA helicase-2/ATP-dependent DNA helicase PcrA